MRECLLAVLLLSWALPDVTLAELLLLTEEAPPTSFLQDGKPAGLAVEVVEQLQQRSARPAHIELQPWTRGYQLVKTQADTALFLMVRTPERESLFQWVGPILQGRTNFYSLKANHLQLHSLEAAKQAGTVAVPKQWYTYEALAALGFDLYGTRGPKQMVRMLKAGRVKLIATEDLTLRGELASGGLTPEEVEAQLVLMKSDYYIAFSRQTDAAVVAEWQRQLDGMREDGSLTAIIQRWLPGVSQP
ncbi:MAG: transporter substrate-binding domain-containing protein [Pseudomonas sp.]|uniref:substrate-binding periplasmic protein n=1 Tax=Pseudomonas sp. TaxID=306 RepID=UPI0027373EDF|nr:transporter substrate-binding domain-containing protein [Pseudomonas sp.]MDP3847454.1 transporter substrate-binding domain-containing protein [Pseudomonas sp.]